MLLAGVFLVVMLLDEVRVLLVVVLLVVLLFFVSLLFHCCSVSSCGVDFNEPFGSPIMNLKFISSVILQ